MTVHRRHAAFHHHIIRQQVAIQCGRVISRHFNHIRIDDVVRQGCGICLRVTPRRNDGVAVSRLRSSVRGDITTCDHQCDDVVCHAASVIRDRILDAHFTILSHTQIGVGITGVKVEVTIAADVQRATFWQRHAVPAQDPLAIHRGDCRSRRYGITQRACQLLTRSERDFHPVGPRIYARLGCCGSVIVRVGRIPRRSHRRCGPCEDGIRRRSQIHRMIGCRSRLVPTAAVAAADGCVVGGHTGGRLIGRCQNQRGVKHVRLTGRIHGGE